MVRLSAGISSKLNEETKHQITLIDWIAIQYPALSKYVIHIANERHSSKLRGYILKRAGLRKGCSDLFIAFPNGFFGGLFIEMKSLKGKLSPHQKEFIELMRGAGFKAVVCYGFEGAMNEVKTYMDESIVLF